jgi:hypothetical protein
LGAASSEIQEVVEGLSAGLLPEPKVDDARITDLARSTWAAAFEADAFDDEDEETVVCRSLERGLSWARWAFDEPIPQRRR